MKQRRVGKDYNTFEKLKEKASIAGPQRARGEWYVTKLVGPR